MLQYWIYDMYLNFMHFSQLGVVFQKIRSFNLKINSAKHTYSHRTKFGKALKYFKDTQNVIINYIWFNMCCSHNTLKNPDFIKVGEFFSQIVTYWQVSVWLSSSNQNRNILINHLGQTLARFTQLKRDKRFNNFIMLVWGQESIIHIAAGSHPVHEA